ncbi:M23 family metallopeptidase [Streptomyces meridianus]|uniref:M23 family metallopeptidase n=1 Tax=Streptomyces meridianus TaxID=2938945 RepID=A0ABT0XFG5_9ACTN|nr:M23 family metallopeptidase [Streptomyces meridianus]MCM2580547.1 M23 family metallopeptidase [Streptomyces meridianus]
MASNRPAPEPWYEPTGLGTAFASRSGTTDGPEHTEFNFFGEFADREPETTAFPEFGAGPESHEGPGAEWNPTEESVAPVRGRHRVARQRGGVARSSAVLGVGMIAAVGAGGMATANERPPVTISMPDLPQQVKDKLPDPASLPGLTSLMSGRTEAAASAEARSDAGETLRARIMRQAEQQQSAAENADREASAEAAAEKAAAQAAKAKAEADAAKKKAAEEAERKAEAERRAKLAASYKLPVSSFTLTSSFGAAGSLWANDHTGQDFAAPTGTPVRAVHGGTITQAGWAGSYGYRIVLTLDDGTEIWYCHLSSMDRTSGKVGVGETIGRVGATGNVTGAHLHLEVRPGGGSPIDPMSWLRKFGLNI